MGGANGKLKEKYEYVMVKNAAGKSIKKQLGSGSYGVVHLVKRKADNQQVALKTIDKTAAELKDDPGADQMLKDEIEVARMLDHPNCVKLFDVFDSKKTLHLVSELCSGGEVFDAIIDNLKMKKDGSGYEGVQYTERVGANMARQIAEGMLYLHGKNIAHRDLKPENLLFDQTPTMLENDPAVLKITDFGLAKHVDGADGKPFMMSTQCGTASYLAPEILMRKKSYNHLVDVWSFAVIVYILLCGYPPFWDDPPETRNQRQKREMQGLPEPRTQEDKICSAQYSFPAQEWSVISEEAKSMIRVCLMPAPRRSTEAVDRPEFADILKHAWFVAPSKNATLPITQNLTQTLTGQRRIRKAALATMMARLMLPKAGSSAGAGASAADDEVTQADLTDANELVDSKLTKLDGVTSDAGAADGGRKE